MYAIAGIIIGGRLGYVLFYEPVNFLANPGNIIRVWDGGMSFHGGAIGVVLGIWFFSWRWGRPFLQVADFLVPTAPLGLAAGRIGNFINGELWAREASEALPWAMRFPTWWGSPASPVAALPGPAGRGAAVQSCCGGTPAGPGCVARWPLRSSSATAPSVSSLSSGGNLTPSWGCSRSG